MEIVNRTPYPLAPLPGRLAFPRHSLTLIVKGTFDLSPDRPAKPAEEQLFPTGDEFYPDDEEATGSCRYESDFAHFKPKADLLLAGTCHVPDARPVGSCRVTFGVGAYQKELRVSGDRHWNGVLGMGTASNPEPFTEKLLRYESSFGGSGFKKNPVGLGVGSEEDESGASIRSLPNIEDPESAIGSRSSRPDPAGFGPLGRMWSQRASKLGSYKKSWLKNRWPWFPEDFDYAHFNGASPDMQVEGYLKGDESLVFKNLHKAHPRYESQLPGVRVRCFLNEIVDEDRREPPAAPIDGEVPNPVAEADSGSFREVEMKLDTLWVDMDAEKLVLVWRGSAEVKSDEYEEMQHLFVMQENVVEPPASIEECRAAFIAGEADAEEAEALSVEPPGEVVEVEAEKEPPPDPAAAAEAAGMVRAQVAGALAMAGMNLDSMPAEAREKLERNIDMLATADSDGIAAMQSEQQAEKLSEALSKVGLDSNDLPEPSPKAKAELVRFLNEIGRGEASAVVDTPEAAGFLGVFAAVLPKLGMDPEDLTPMIEQAKKIPGLIPEAEELPEEEAEAEPERVRPLTREIVVEEAARGEAFVGEDFSGLDLSELELKALDFSGADFSGANLHGADLSDAILTGAVLEGVDLAEATCVSTIFEGANLSGAKLQGANLETADMRGVQMCDAVLDGATLKDAAFLGANMSNVSLRQADATETLFVGADLQGAAFGKAVLDGADFSKATVSGADFRESSLVDATLEGAICVEADFSDADLTRLRASEGADFSGCTFVGVKGLESIWEGSNLVGADFSFAQMPSANFMKTSLERASLHAANMKGARFIRANLREATLTDMNLFEGSLEKADLSGADLSRSNLYAAEFLDAILSDTTLEETNLRMTKLA